MGNRLRFGTKVVEDSISYTLLSDVLYERLPDRKDCVICGGPLRNPTLARLRRTRASHYPCCNKECRKKYTDWLNNNR